MSFQKKSSQIITGKKVVLEFLLNSPQKIELLLVQRNRIKDIKELLELCQKQGVRYQFVPVELLNRISSFCHQGFVARIYSPGFIEEEDVITRLDSASFPVALALDQVQDQGNIGALARTLYCLGGASLIITRNRSAHLGERAFKSSAGALGHLAVARVTNLKRFLRLCGNKGVWRYYASNETDCISIYKIEVKFPLVLVLGNEEKGIRPSVKKACDVGVKIPMLGNFDSLNVAQAGCIVLGEFFRQWLNKG